DNLALLKILHELLTLLRTCFFEDGAARNHDVPAAPVHLQYLELLGDVHQRSDIADRTNIDLRPRQERHSPVQIYCEAALDLVEYDALHFFAAVEGLLQLAPALFAARLVARQHGLAKGVLNTLKIDFDLIADLEIGLPSGPGKFPKRHTSFGLQTDIDDGKFLFDADDLSLDDGTFLKISAAKAFVEQFGE